VNTVEFLSYLNDLDIQISAEGDRLRINAPKGVLTPALRTQLTERKADILTFLQQVQFAADGTPPRISPASRDRDVPLSFAQQRLWFLDQLEPGNSTYNVAQAYRLAGPINRVALEQSFNEIVRRHDTLRTTFSVADRQPVQVIHPAVTVPVTVIDLSDVPENEREIQVQQLVVKERSRRFKLDQGPLLYITLLRLEVDEHILLLTMHHIISDEWSIDLLFRELAEFYKSYSNGIPPTMPELPIQYADFTVWQREWLQGKVLEKQLTYWKQQLDSLPHALELPTDRPRPPAYTQRGGVKSKLIAKVSSKALKQLSQQEEVTLFMALLTAFKTLLYRYTAQDDIVVGTPIANRSRVELGGLIGFFVNTLVLRTQLSGEPTFRELLARVREVSLEAYTHQDLPFEKLVEELQPERDMSRTPLFQVMFILHNASGHSLELQGLTVSPLTVDVQSAKFDLTLYVAEEAEGLRTTFEYNADLFDEITISRMLGHFETLLEGIVANPDRRLSDLPLLTKAERQQLLTEWNNTRADYPIHHCFHQLFEDQAARTPDKIAVSFEDQQLTYSQLNARANQLAHYLRQRGVGPEVLVGICVERSLEMMIGLLGILKAGGAYVPLDPAYPKERVALMIEDARVPVLLTQQKLVAGLPEQEAAVVRLDADMNVIARENEANPDSGVTPENLAYVIYTSGSTGRPKGVQIGHRSLVNFLSSMRRSPGLTGEDSLLAVTTISFDIAALELYLPLLTGGQVILASREVAGDGVRLLSLLERCEATVMQATPATWRMLLAQGWPGDRQLKILCGGEALPGELAGQLFERSASLWNLYGPTETTIWSSVYQIEADRSEAHAKQAAELIGRPLANTQTFILDRHLKPVPVGVSGELYIGGDGLARGYLNHPELTAERFIRSPFSDTSGTRLYKTGDLARYRPDGNIEFLGRIDHQVKVRGFRIELGKIEVILGRHRSVREAVVVVREGVGGDRRLAAYLIPNEESTVPNVTELRGFLKEKLPEYMIPAAFVILTALPLTPNGKVDRRALPEPDLTRPELESTFVAPRTEDEKIIAEIWVEVLGLEQVGIYDNFFELGGHSLLATQVVARIRETFQVELPLRTIFEALTVADLAVTLVQRESEHVDDEMLAQILAELEELPDDEVRLKLSGEKPAFEGEDAHG
jgi:amino acid adenylation domain-containing protein